MLALFLGVWYYMNVSYNGRNIGIFKASTKINHTPIGAERDNIMKSTITRTILTIGLAGILTIGGAIGNVQFGTAPLTLQANATSESVRHVSNGVTFYFDADVYGQLPLDEFDYMVATRMNTSDWIRPERTYRVHGLTATFVRISVINGHGTTLIYRLDNWQSGSTSNTETIVLAPVTTPLPNATPTPIPPMNRITETSPTPNTGNEIFAVLFDRPTLLSNNELLELIENAQSHLDTRPNSTLPNRHLTNSELVAWIAEYEALGGINAFELEVVRLINIERARAGLHPLQISPELMMATRFKCHEMFNLNIFSHASSVYDSIPVLFGHDPGVAGNMFNMLNYPHVSNPEFAVNGWMNSEGHRRNMLSDAVTIGVGVIANDNGGVIVYAKFGW